MLSSEVTGSILVFFLLYFLTNVAGLNPALAGSVLLIGKVWDALTDPIVGWLSDRTRSPLGRRYPWMLFGAVPLGLCFFLLWWVPTVSGQGGLFLYYCTIALVFSTAYTTVVIPYATLAAELTQGYDERTSLAGYRAGFSIGSSILSLVVAQVILSQIADPHRQYEILGAICGGVAALGALLCVWGTYRRFHSMQAIRQLSPSAPSLPFLHQIGIAFRCRPFLYVIGIYLCSWLGLQVTAAILPYFVVEWMGLPETHFTQMALTVQGTALVSMFMWSAIALRFGKQAIYWMGIPVTLCAQAGLFLLQPGQVVWMYGLAAAAGFGLSTAYIVPWSMLPDVVDLDELNTGQRREGIFYGFMVQIQKIAVAIALFMVGKTLDWSGLIPASADVPSPIQPDSVLWTIRWLIGPIPSLVLIGGLVMAWRYPITRSAHAQILQKLSLRRTQTDSPARPLPKV